jgi:hypothetical protein
VITSLLYSWQLLNLSGSVGSSVNCTVQWFKVIIFFSSTRSKVASILRVILHTQWHTTVRKTPLDGGSAHRRALYLTTYNTHNRQTSIPPAELFHSLVLPFYFIRTYSLSWLSWFLTFFFAVQYPCPGRELNKQPQQASGRRPSSSTARSLGAAAGKITGWYLRPQCLLRFKNFKDIMWLYLWLKFQTLAVVLHLKVQKSTSS